MDDVCNVGCPPVARPGPATAHGCRSQALSARRPRCLKPPSPLQTRSGCFGCVFRLHWCCRFQRRHATAACARKSSPCSARCGREREKVRPAHEKWPKMSVLWRAGRTFSRKHRRRGCAGRSFSRNSCGTERAGRVLSHHHSGTPAAGRTSSQIEQGTDLLGPPRADGHEKALPKECLAEMQNPHRWIAPRGAAARPKGLEPPTF